MILTYGSFSFQANKAWLDVRRQPFHSKRGFRMFVRHTFTFGGTVVGADLTALETLIDDAQAAFLIQNADFKLFQNDGTTPTKHAIATADTLDGVKVVEFRWLKGSTVGGRGNGTEYVNKRSFIGTVVGDVASNENETVEWNETVSLHGTGALDFTIQESITGSPQAELTQNATGVILIQQGSGVGWSAYPAFPDPLVPGSLRGKAAVLEKAAPIYGRNGNRLFPIRWRYVHELITAPGSVPTPTAPPT